MIYDSGTDAVCTMFEHVAGERWARQCHPSRSPREHKFLTTSNATSFLFHKYSAASNQPTTHSLSGGAPTVRQTSSVSQTTQHAQVCSCGTPLCRLATMVASPNSLSAHSPRAHVEPRNITIASVRCGDLTATKEHAIRSRDRHNL